MSGLAHKLAWDAIDARETGLSTLRVTEKVIIPGLRRAHREWKSAQTSERLAQLEAEWAEEVHLFDTPEYAAMIKARADAEWDAL